MSTNTSALFTPFKLGKHELKHRIVLAPMTRMRANLDTVPSDLMKEFYSQRATEGGLLITEATFIDRLAGSYPQVPGIYTQEQIAGWKRVTEAVHAKGGIIFLQIWHLGRVSSAALNEGQQPVSASAIKVKGNNFAGQPYEAPRALTVPEIKELTAQFRQASINAVEAGFDGVEIHAANGYLLDQFINSNSNARTDAYGGSIENRARFPLEVTSAIVDAIGADRTAIRFSPWSNIQDMGDATPYETWGYLVQQLQARHPDLAYVHMVEPRSSLFHPENLKTSDSLDPFRQAWKGAFISAGGYTYDKDLAFQVAEKTGNLIAIGRQFLANPDLVERFRNGWPFNHYDRSTFHGGTEVGYTDYPFYKE